MPVQLCRQVKVKEYVSAIVKETVREEAIFQVCATNNENHYLMKEW